MDNLTRTTRIVPASYEDPAKVPPDDADPLIDALIADVPVECQGCGSDISETAKRKEMQLATEYRPPYSVVLLECRAKDIHDCNCEFCIESKDCDTILAWAVLAPSGEIAAIGKGVPRISRLVDEGKILPPEAYPMLPMEPQQV